MTQSNMSSTPDSNHPIKPSPFTSKTELIFIILIPFGGLALAAWMYFAGAFLPESRNHQGNMLTPPLNIEAFNGPRFDIKTLNNEWGLVVVASGSCDKTCRDVLYKTRQAHVALNRNQTRISRFFVTPTVGRDEEIVFSNFMKDQHPGVTTLKGSMPSMDFTTDESVRVFLVDPLGNVMLWYGQEHDGKQILKDMEKLLKASRIG